MTDIFCKYVEGKCSHCGVLGSKPRVCNTLVAKYRQQQGLTPKPKGCGCKKPKPSG